MNLPARYLSLRKAMQLALVSAFIAVVVPSRVCAAPVLNSGIVRGASQIVSQPDGKVLAVSEPTTDGAPLAIVRLNADGSTDSSFTEGTPFPLELDSIQRLADGRFLLAGTFPDPATAGAKVQRLVRLNAGGTLDTAFQPGAAYAPQPVVQKDGRILLLGSSILAGGVVQPVLSRLQADGTADTSWQPGVDLLTDGTYDLSLQPDGKVLLAGGDGASTGQPSLQRLNTDGTLDATFQVTGPVATGFGVAALAQTVAGKVIVAEYLSDDDETCTLNRLNTDGTPDPTFTSPGTLNGDVDALATDASGRIILSGDFTSIGGAARAGFARLNNDGSVDPTFIPVNTQDGALQGFSVTPAGTITFALSLTAADGIDPATDPGVLLERLSADNTSASAVRIIPCPACELVPSADGSGVLVQVEPDDSTPDPIFIAPPPTSGGGIVNNLPLVTLKSIRSRVFSGGSRKGKFIISRTGDLSSDLTVPYMVKGRAIEGRDYQVLRGYRTIHAGKSQARIRVKPIFGYFPRVFGRHAGVRLVLETGAAYQIGTPAVARVRIVNRSLGTPQ